MEAVLHGVLNRERQCGVKTFPFPLSKARRDVKERGLYLKFG